MYDGYVVRQKEQLKHEIVVANSKFYGNPLKISDFYPEQNKCKTAAETMEELKKLKEEFGRGKRN